MDGSDTRGPWPATLPGTMHGRIHRETALAALTLLLLGGCSGPEPVAPAPSIALGAPHELVAGEQVSVEVRVTGVDLKPGSSLLLGLRHPWYGASGGLLQIDDPEGPGFVTVLEPPGARLAALPHRVDPGPVRVSWPSGLGAEQTARIRVDRLAAQRFSEPAWRPLVLLDPGGDAEVRELEITDSRPIVAGPIHRLRVLAPSHAEVGEAVSVHVVFEDRWRNSVPNAQAVLKIGPRTVPGSTPLEVTVRSGPAGQAAPVADVAVAGQTGALRVEVEATLDDGRVLTGRSNPIGVGEAWPEVWFGDLHGHTARSDGTGTPAEAWQHARDVARVDFAAVTDHGWQLSPGDWEELRAAAREARVEGEFGTLLAYEYELGGHRCVYFRDDLADVHASPVGPRGFWEVLLNRRAPLPPPAPDVFDADPSRLYRSLPRGKALAIQHTSASPWMGDSFERVVVPFSPVVEIYSAHGQSEDATQPSAVVGARPEGEVSGALRRGLPFGLIAAGDGHGGHLGRTVWGGFQGGLAAVLAPSPDGADVFDAIAAGRTYATTGGRPLLDMTARRVEDEGPGSARIAVRVRYEADAALDWIDVLVDEEVERVLRPAGRGEGLDTAFELEPASLPALLRVRAVEVDGARAWSSPIRVLPLGAADLSALGGAAGEDGSGVDLVSATPAGHPGFAVARWTGTTAPQLEGSGWTRVGLIEPGRSGFREPWGAPPSPVAYRVEDLGSAVGSVVRHGPIWSMPPEAPSPPASRRAPLVVGGLLGPGRGASIHPIGQPRKTVGTLPAGQTAWSPPPDARADLEWRDPEGQAVWIAVVEPLPGTPTVPARVVVRPVDEGQGP